MLRQAGKIGQFNRVALLGGQFADGGLNEPGLVVAVDGFVRSVGHLVGDDQFRTGIFGQAAAALRGTDAVNGLVPP